MKNTLITLMSVFFLSSCATQSIRINGDAERLLTIENVENNTSQMRLKANLEQSIHFYTKDQTDYDVAFDDLNNDGKEDAIVLLKGLNWCGSGGCTMLVFKGKVNQEFDFLSKTTLVDTPVYSTTYRHNDWKQLLVYSRKHGQVMLKFDGTKYPLNPSLLPVLNAKLAPNSAQLLFGQP